MKKFGQKIKLFHVLGIFLFLLAFCIRLLAIRKINPTDNEARLLLNLGEPDKKYIFPFLQQVIVHFFSFFWGNQYLPVRIFNAFFGSLLILCPFLYQRYLGLNASILLSAVLCFDPFFITNSTLVNGYNLVMLMAAICIAFLLKKQYRPACILLMLLFISGQLFGYLLISAVCLVVYSIAKKALTLADIKRELNHLGTEIRDKRIYLLTGVLVCLIGSASLNINLSSIFSEPAKFIAQAGFGYSPENSPLAYFIALLSYLPITVILLPIGIYWAFVLRSEKIGFMLYWIIISGIMVCFNHSHQYFDLIWVALPIWTAISIMLSENLFYPSDWRKSDIITLALLLVILISIMITLLSIVYRIGVNASMTEQVLLIIILFTVLLIMMILYAYIHSIKSGMRLLGLCGLIIGLTFQLSITARSAGLNHRPQFELFWEGYFTDADVFLDIVEKSRYKQLGTRGNLNVAFYTDDHPIETLLLRKAGFSMDQVFSTRDLEQSIIITDRGELDEAANDYHGQRFIRKSYPIWILSPWNNVFTYDYWSWFFFRQSNLYNEYNYLWIKTGGDYVE